MACTMMDEDTLTVSQVRKMLVEIHETSGFTFAEAKVFLGTDRLMGKKAKAEPELIPCPDCLEERKALFENCGVTSIVTDCSTCNGTGKVPGNKEKSDDTA